MSETPEAQHGHGQAHARGHEHLHDRSPGSASTAFAWGFTLNLVFVIVEAAAGFMTNSLALLADAGHNLSDLLALAIAWGAVLLGQRRPSPRFTYGLRGSSILAALFNALLLLVACGAIAWEAVERLTDPTPVQGMVIIAVAALGVIINTATAMMFARGRNHDLNRRSVFLHMAADAAISLGVVIAGGLILLTDWLWLDPVLSLAIVVVIVAGTWALLRDAIHMAVHAVPAGIDPAAVGTYLKALPGVSSIHDLHIWAMSTAETALTVHLVMRHERPDDRFYAEIAQALERRFGIQHATVQVERGDGSAACGLAPEEVV